MKRSTCKIGNSLATFNVIDPNAYGWNHRPMSLYVISIDTYDASL
jgi:hypothetical protein